MRLAKDGLPTICALTLTAICAFVVSRTAGCAMLVPVVLAVWFYRDPDRVPPEGDAWVSPADGKVVEIIEGALDEYAGRTTKIGIFMNGFDVHVNRCPADGTVEVMRYVPGKKWLAFAPKASELNERLHVGIRTEAGRTTLVQIAGILARRIACHTNIGAALARGERYGMIKLGSKVDLYLPDGIEPTVKIGDTVRAGETVIGVIKR